MMKKNNNKIKLHLLQLLKTCMILCIQPQGIPIFILSERDIHFLGTI